MLSRLQANLELILTSFVDEYYIRLSNSFPPPHFALACYTLHIFWEISDSHCLGLRPSSTPPTRLSTHSTFIFKFFACTLDLNPTDVHCDPSQVNGSVGRYVILYMGWFLKKNWRLCARLIRRSVFWKLMTHRNKGCQDFNRRSSLVSGFPISARNLKPRQDRK